MIDTLRESLNMQQCIFGALVFVVLFLMVICALLIEVIEKRLPSAHDAEVIRAFLTDFPPEKWDGFFRRTDKPDEPPDDKRVREAREGAEAWTRLQNYSAADAYGGDGG